MTISIWVASMVAVGSTVELVQAAKIRLTSRTIDGTDFLIILLL